MEIYSNFLDLVQVRCTCCYRTGVSTPDAPDDKKTNRVHMLLILHPTNFGFFPL